MAKDPEPKKEFELTAYHVRWIFFGAFAVIISANLAMVVAATGSFPGVTAKNSFVASQEFTARVAERERLGWRLAVDHRDGRLIITARDAADKPVEGLTVSAVVGRPSDAATDQSVVLSPGVEAGAFTADLPLAVGVWRVDVRAEGAGGEYVSGATNLHIR